MNSCKLCNQNSIYEKLYCEALCDSWAQNLQTLSTACGNMSLYFDMLIEIN